MAVVVASGDTTATGSAQELANIDTRGTYQLAIDLSEMQSGDALTVKIISKIGSGGTDRTIYEETFSGAQTGVNDLQIGPPVPSGWEYAVTIEQTAGGLRGYKWRIDAIGSVSVEDSGTLNLAGTTDTTAYSTGDNGSFVFVVDLGAMQATEVVTLRAYQLLEALGSAMLAYEYVAPTGVQVAPDILMASLPLSAAYGGEWHVQQNHSNSRGYPYVVYKVAA